MLNRFKTVRMIAIMLLVMAAAVSAVACSAKPGSNETVSAEPADETASAEPADETASAEPADETTPEAAAAAAYREIIAKADTYEYGAGEDENIVGYKYALVTMQNGDIVPTLLVAQQTEFGVDYVRVFRYDPQTGAVCEPQLPEGSDPIMQGAAGRGGFRGELSVLEDGSGLCIFVFYSGTGDGTMSRIAADGDSLIITDLWSGNAEETAPFAVQLIENWHDVSDGSGLAE